MPSWGKSWSEDKYAKDKRLAEALPLMPVRRSTDTKIKNGILQYIKNKLDVIFDCERYTTKKGSDGGLDDTSLVPHGQMDADFVREKFMAHVEEKTKIFTTMQDFKTYFETQEAYNTISGMYYLDILNGNQIDNTETSTHEGRMRKVFNDAILHEKKRLDDTYGKPAQHLHLRYP